jgi:hypothetical protein
MADTDDIDPNEICSRGSISGAEVAAIRRGYHKDGIVSVEEADALFAIEDHCRTSPPVWGQLFVEALTDYVVHQMTPAGYVTADNAAWLLARIADGDTVATRNGLELLLKVMEEARWCPAILTSVALAQVKDAVMNGTGPLRLDARKPARGVVTAADVAVLRRILFAAGGDGNLAVTRIEAEALMDIADATDEALCDPSWPDLYAKAVANHLVAASGHAVPTREEALAVEVGLEAEPELGGYFHDMIQCGLSGVWEAYSAPSLEAMALERVNAQTRALLVNEEITEPEARWLVERMLRDGRISQAEEALLSFLKANSPKIDPVLEPLLAKVA